MDIAKFIKTTVIFSIVGFVLSFLFGIIWGGAWGYVFLRAILFALLFAGLGAGSFWVYDRYLRVDSTDSDEESDNRSSLGGRIDLVSEDGADSDYEMGADSARNNGDSRNEDSLDEEGELLEVGGADIDLESVGKYESSMTDLDDLAENFAAMGDSSISLEPSDEFNVNGTELGDRPASGGSGYSGAGSSYSSDVSLEDIGGPDSTPQDYAKVVRTMIKKDG